MRFLPTAGEARALTPGQIEALIPKLAETCRRLPVVLLYLHGSHAHGTQTRLSDLDLALLMEPRAARERSEIAAALSALESACERDDVDVVILNGAGTIIRDRVVRLGRLVYARNDLDRIRFETSAVKEFLDFEPYSRTYNDAFLRRLREGRFLG
jgi:hypothetical protein